MSNIGIYGPIITGAAVRKGLLEFAQLWMPAYLGEVGVQNGLARSGNGSIPMVRSWNGSAKGLALNAGNQLPACVVICAGTIGKPERHGDGMVSAEWAMGIGFVVSATTQEDTNDLLSYYLAAARAMALQHPGLGGIASDTRWMGDTLDEIPFRDARTLAGGCVNLGVRTDGVVNSRAGLKDPPVDITITPPDTPEIHAPRPGDPLPVTSDSIPIPVTSPNPDANTNPPEPTEDFQQEIGI